MSRDNITRWSNAKRARMFVRVISAILKDTEAREARIPVELLEGPLPAVGMVVEDGVLIIALDNDPEPGA